MVIQQARVTLTFTGLVLGGLPNDQTALRYANVQRAEVGADEVQSNELPAEEETKETGRCVFRRNGNGEPVVDEHMIRGIVREAVRKLGMSKPMRGFWMMVHTTPYLMKFSKGASMVEEVRAFRAMGPAGPRNVLIIHEALLTPTLEFILEVHDGESKYKKAMEQLPEILAYAGRYVGFGAARGKSGLRYHYGLFDVGGFELGKGKKVVQ